MTKATYEISDSESADQFLKGAAYLHDSLLKSMALTSRGYVDHELRMYGYGEEMDCEVVFHLQNSETPCVKVTFVNVKDVCFTPSFEIEPKISFLDNEISFSFAERVDESKSRILCERIMYSFCKLPGNKKPS